MKDKRITRTPGDFCVCWQALHMQTCSLLEPFSHVGAASVDCGSSHYLSFSKSSVNRKPSSKLSGCGMYPRYRRVSVQDVKEDYSVWDLVNSFCAAIFVPESSDALLRSCSCWLLLTYVCKQSWNGLLDCYNLKHHFL